MTRLLVVALLIVARLGPGTHAADRRAWTTRDTVLEVTFASTLLVDTMQTVHFLREGRQERNLILGARPTVGNLVAYDAVSIGLHAAIAWALPRPYRTIWQVAWIGVEAAQIGSNVRVHGAFHVTLPWSW